MALMLNTILAETGIPLADIRLVKHKDKSAQKGRTPYELWRDDRPKFESYQSTQRIKNRKKMNAPCWAVFVVDTNDDTMFAGLYAVTYLGLNKEAIPMQTTDGVDEVGSCDVYDLRLLDDMSDLIGRLFIDWGAGTLAWVQYASKRDKPITEIRKSFSEPDFPGFLNFIQPLSKLNNMPKSWIVALQASKGIYLLTCPKTKEQYVGSAKGPDGFWGRFQDYMNTGHGGNVALKSRQLSDYQVSILEVAGSSATPNDILEMEGRWQTKLQSAEMGLNRNIAKKL